MAKKRIKTTFLTALIGSCFIVFFYSCKEKSLGGMIVLTQMESDIQSNDYITGNSWRYLPNARIVAIYPNKPNKSLQVLTQDFFSACTPKISYNGKFMLFAAQKKQNDIWQIWEMNLSNLKTRQVTFSTENCIDPDYLPGERLVFSKVTNNTNLKTGHSLFTSNLDGSNNNQITFNPSTYFASTILKDGRIVTIGKQLFPKEKEGMFMVMRPDGTKQELFYNSPPENSLQSRVWETDNGKLVFIESDSNNIKNIVAINYNRPLHSKAYLSSDIEGDFYAISPYEEGKLLSTYRSSNEDLFALYEFNTENKTLGKAIYKDEKYHVLEAIAVKKQNRPKKLPSEIDLNVKTALLVCQDINFTYSESYEDSIPGAKATRLEILGIDSSFGILDVEEDGSFYIKITADTPFRFQTIDENNNVVKDSDNWLYLRPNERRGCVGCHENNEMVPKNVQPLAVRKDPVLVPMKRNEIANKMDLKN